MVAVGLLKRDTASLGAKRVFQAWDLETGSHVAPVSRGYI